MVRTRSTAGKDRSTASEESEQDTDHGSDLTDLDAQEVPDTAASKPLYGRSHSHPLSISGERHAGIVDEDEGEGNGEEGEDEVDIRQDLGGEQGFGAPTVPLLKCSQILYSQCRQRPRMQTVMWTSFPRPPNK